MTKGRLKTTIVSLILWTYSGMVAASGDITQTLNDSVFSFSNDLSGVSNLRAGGTWETLLQSAGNDDKDDPAGIENPGYALSVLQQLQVETELTPETTDLFGEQINLSTGALSFVQTDVSIPGNSALPVTISRKLLDPKDRYNGTREFGLWSLDLPHISTSLVKGRLSGTEFSGAWGQGQACSGRLLPDSYSPPGHGTHVGSHEYWNGDSIYIPGKGNAAINSFVGGNGRQAKENWKIDCFDTGDNYEGFIVTTDDGTQYTFGQLRIIPGIELTKPRHWTPSSPSPAPTFDRKGKCISQCEYYDIYHAFMLVTRVEDRFGNQVNYHYTDHSTSEGSRRLLTSVTANDGRAITINYKVNDVIVDNIVTNGRTWTYHYNEEVTHPQVDYLTSITLPDLRQWTFRGYSDMYITEGIPADFYEDPRDPARYCVVNPRATTLTITHPDGLSGTFTTKNSVQGRTEVPKIPIDAVLPDGTINTYAVKRCYSSLSVTGKTLTHPSGETDTWTYHYSENPGSFEDQGEPDYLYDDKIPVAGLDTLGLPAVTVAANGFELADLKSTTVMAPDSSKAVHYFVRRYDWLEGAEVFVDYYDTDGTTLLKRIQKNYQQGQPQGEYSLKSYAHGNEEVRLTRQLLNRQVTFQNSNTYTTAYSDFNTYEVARKVSESNDLTDGRSKFTRQGFRHDTTRWVLNQPTTVSVSETDDAGSFRVVSETTYHDAHTAAGAYADWNVPYKTRRFGTWVSKNVSYHANGLVQRTEFNRLLKKADGTDSTDNRYRDIISYHRGQPTEIRYPARYSDSANATVTQTQTVDNNGWVTELTDLNNVKTRYGYTAMGRLTYIDAPDDANHWQDTWFTWSHKSDGALLGTLARCTLNAAKTACSDTRLTVTTEYDGLLRAVKTHTRDEINGLSRYQTQTFNPWNNLTYQSYPADTEAGTTGAGHFSTYDGLQRLNTASQTGGGTHTTTYLSGNRIRVTEPVTDSVYNTTTTTFLAYGAPAYAQFIHIDSPEAVSTRRKVNVFGDITEITQSGPGAGNTTVTLTEYRAYDTQHYLCKVSRSDVGTTWYQHSAVGEVLMMEQGATGGTNSDCVRDEPTPEESTDIIITRDNLGSVWQVAYPDDAGRDLTYTRDALGNVTHLSAGTGGNGVVQQYAYNSLNLPVSETLTVNGTRLAPGADKASVVYTYNTLGQTDSLTYPDGVAVAFAPNAFGEPTQVARVANSYATAHAYVTNARYYPTGALDSFHYHNGLTHKTTLNSRKLPQRIRDAGATVTALDYAYTYDYALNITRLLDGRDSATRQYSLTDLSYDGLNRLTATTGGADIGNSHITYDGLGNILTYRSKDRDFSYHYNAPGGTDVRKNLLRRVDHAGDPAIEYKRFSYDDRGNVTSNGFNNFTYNRANQMVTADNNHYVYDGHNRRVSKTNSEGTEYSLYTLDGTLLYRQTDSGGINYVYLGNKLVAKDGFIPEDSGVQHYRPFGEAIEEPADDVGYTGHKYDADIGLSYMQARYYDPSIGRFYANDPVSTIGHIGRGNGIQGFNRYAYANNNPYKYVDPDGRAAQVAQLGWTIGTGVNYLITATAGASLGVLIYNAIHDSSSDHGSEPSGYGDLTNDEVSDIQDVVDEAGRPLTVVGSAAEGKRRNPGSNLPIGKGEGTQSDIDYVAGPSSIGNFDGLEDQLPGIDPETGIIPGNQNPNIGPGIRFEPGQKKPTNINVRVRRATRIPMRD